MDAAQLAFKNKDIHVQVNRQFVQLYAATEYELLLRDVMTETPTLETDVILRAVLNRSVNATTPYLLVIVIDAEITKGKVPKHAMMEIE